MADDIIEWLRLEAQMHAQEARTANDTIYKIYQIVSGGRGEPGNWHGAEPVRQYIESSEARIRELESEIVRTRTELGETRLVLEQTERNADCEECEDAAMFIRKLAQEDGK